MPVSKALQSVGKALRVEVRSAEETEDKVAQRRATSAKVLDHQRLRLGHHAFGFPPFGAVGEPTSWRAQAIVRLTIHAAPNQAAARDLRGP